MLVRKIHAGFLPVSVFVNFVLAVFILSIFFQVVSCKSAPENVAIIELVRSGNTKELSVKFDKSTVNAKDENGYTLLHIAAKQDSYEVTDFLCSMGANTEEPDNEGKTALLYALELGSMQAVRALTAYDAGIFTEDNSGMSPFLFAKNNSLNEAVLNVKTVRQRDKNGRTPLHHAVMNFDKFLVQYILNLGKPSFGKDKDGLSVLDYVYKNPHNAESASIAYSLLSSGAEPLHREFAEFETSVLKRNYAMRFYGGKTALHVAAKNGFAVFVRFLLEAGAPVDAKDESHSSALHEAVRNGHVQCVLSLLSYKADVNALDVSGNTPMHLVMPEPSRKSIFSELLKAGASPLIKDNYGETVLHVAARIGMSGDIVSMLVKAGAQVNERNKKGQSPLFLSVTRKDMELSKLFVSLGADIHAADTAGKTCFTAAADSGLAMVKSIVNENNVSSRDSFGRTSVHLAVEREASAEILDYLIGLKTDINTRDMAGDTALHIAAERNNKSAGSILLSNGADIFYVNDKGVSPLQIALTRRGGREEWMITSRTLSAKDGRGNTALHLACEWGLASSAAYIIERGAEVNAVNVNNETALFCAVKANSPSSVQVLLGRGGGKKGADVNLRDFLGNCALHTAVRWSAYEAAQTLLNSGYKMTEMKNLAGKTPLHAASHTGDISFIRLFLSNGAEVNSLDEMGKTPLSEAVLAGKKEAVQVLLQNNASPVTQDMYGQSPLHEAVISGNTVCINMIRSAGGNPMARGVYGQTPFTLSLYKGVNIIEAVLGRDKFLADSDGRTPLHAAVAEGAGTEVMKFILSKGYPVNKRDKNGETALFYAVAANEKESVSLLLAAGSDPFIANNAGASAVSLILRDRKEFLEMLAEFSEGKSDTLGDNVLHYAARFADAETLRKLLTLTRTDLNTKNTSGETPYKVALRWSKTEAAALLNPDKTARDTAEPENVKSGMENTGEEKAEPSVSGGENKNHETVPKENSDSGTDPANEDNPAA